MMNFTRPCGKASLPYHDRLALRRDDLASCHPLEVVVEALVRSHERDIRHRDRPFAAPWHALDDEIAAKGDAPVCDPDVARDAALIGAGAKISLRSPEPLIAKYALFQTPEPSFPEGVS